jgi:hypothetical protein
MNNQTVIAVVVLSVLSWFSGMYFTARIGGWAALARQFPAGEPLSGKSFRFCSGSIGRANYGGCLTLRVTDSGLHVSAGLFGIPILLWHPPLLIPWSEFHSTVKSRFLFWESTSTYVGIPVIAHMTLPGWFAEYIIERELPRMARPE